MIVEAFVLSIIVGFIRKGSLRNLSRVPIRHFYLFCLPFLIFAAVSTIAVSMRHESLMPYIRPADICQYVILLAAIFLNFHMREMWVVGAGVLSNLAVLAANGGTMPVSMEALKRAGLAGALGSQPVRHAILTPETRLKPLADIIPVHTFSSFMSQVISAGDILIAIGLFILIQSYMCRPAKEPSTGG
ncbi:MAG TPA: DUF5317 domain-containing protein [Armatimonadota bacterium]|nr:DUF5317 domain-containing protein [Armatimonadota bacterium]